MDKKTQNGKAQLLLLKDINEAANRGEKLDSILQKAVQGVAGIFGYKACDLFLLENDNTLRYANIAIDSAILKAVEKLTGLTIIGYRIQLFEGSCFKEVLDKKAPVLLNDMIKVFRDYTTDENLKKLAPAVAKIVGFHHAVRVPMLSNGRALGVLGAASDKRFSNEDVEALELFSSHLAGIVERSRIEESLRESEARYRMIFNSGNDAVFVHKVKEDGTADRFIEVNKIACEKLGYSKDELLKLSPHDIITPSLRGDPLGIMELLRTDGQAVFEMVVETKEGVKIPFEISSHIFKLRGEPTVLSVCRDVSDRKKAEEIIKNLKDLNESIIEEAPIAIEVVNRDFVVRAWNRFCEEYVNIKKEDMLGKNFFDVIPPMRKLGWDVIFKKVMDTGVPYSARDYKIMRTFGPHKGEIWYQDVTVAPLKESGKITGAIVLLNDVTERKRAEETVRELKEFNENIIESAPVAIQVMDRDFNVLGWNRSFEEYVGIKKEDIIGRNLYEVIPSLKRLGWDHIHRDVMENGVPHEKRGYKIKRTFGPHKGEFWYQNVKVVPLKKDGGNIGAVTIVEDVTDLHSAQESLLALMEELKEMNKKLEEANIRLKESDKLKTVFLAGVSHELRTPLNSIIGFTGVILQGLSGELDKEQKKQLGIVYSSSKHLLGLIEDLLDISIIEADEIRLHLEEFNIKEVVNESIEIVTPYIQKKGLKLRKRITDKMIFSDKKRFRQVLVNLLDNAIKYTEKGRIFVRMSSTLEWVTVAVEDTGIGIREKDVAGLFTPFQHVDPPQGKIREGAGLGLYLSKKIITKLGGGISYDRVYKEGARFVFTIPVRFKEVNLK